jgi:hypothetical protein
VDSNRPRIPARRRRAARMRRRTSARRLSRTRRSSTSGSPTKQWLPTRGSNKPVPAGAADARDDHCGRGCPSTQATVNPTEPGQSPRAEESVWPRTRVCGKSRMQGRASYRRVESSVPLCASAPGGTLPPSLPRMDGRPAPNLRRLEIEARPGSSRLAPAVASSGSAGRRAPTNGHLCTRRPPGARFRTSNRLGSS